MKNIEISPVGNHMETLGNCGGYYACPKDPTTGKRLGKLVGYAGTYEAPNGTRKRFVGEVFANWAKAEPHPQVMKNLAVCAGIALDNRIGIGNIDVLVGAPIGGYSLTDALGLGHDIDMVKAEKQVIAVKTETDREKSKLVFARHDVESGQRAVIVEDVCNNFSTTRELIGLILSRGATVSAIVCFLNRSLTVDD